MALRRLTRAEREQVRREIDRLVKGGRTRAPRMLYARLRGVDPEDIRAVLAGAGREAAEILAADVAAQIARASVVAGRLSAGHLAGADGLSRGASAWVRARAREGWTSAADSGRRWSQALYAEQSARMSHDIGTALARVTRGTETVTRAAQMLRDDVGFRVPITPRGPGAVRVPKRIVELQRAARDAIRTVGDPEAQAALRRALAKMETQTERLVATSRGTRAAGRTLAREVAGSVEKLNAQALDDAVEWWAWKREQVHQTMIVRTETARAFNEAYVGASKGIPWVVAFEWNTDDDPCEECEALGGKVFPRDALAEMPRHPNCRCFYTEVIDTDLEPTEEQWQDWESEG